MSKVYIVTSGKYSNYSIEACFTTKEKAEKFIEEQKKAEKYFVFNEIEEYILDSNEISEDTVWVVIIGKDDGFVEMYIRCGNAEKVKKIASERLFQIKALEQIKYPKLRDGYSYDYITGKSINMINFNELRDRAYNTACRNGWHDEELSDDHCLMMIITEIAEAVQADRNNRHADVAKFKEWQGNSLPLSEETRTRRFKEDFEAYIKNSVEDELSDVVIRCLDLAGLRKFDLEEVAVLAEMAESIREGKGFTDLCYVLSGISTCDDSTEEKVIGIIAAVLKYCEFTGIDLPFFIRTKMNYNRLRGYHHGGKKY